MKRIILLGGLVYLLILVGLGARLGGVIVLAVPIVVYIGAALLYGPRPPSLRIERATTPERAVTGDVVKVQVQVVNEGSTLEQVLLVDRVPPELELLDGQPSLLAALPHGATVELEYQARVPRGYHRFPGLDVTTGDLLGVVFRETTVAAPARLFVMPRALRLHRLTIRPRRTHAYAGNVPAHQGGPGVEFFGLREYQPGDALGRIDWRASARRPDELFTKEYEQERVTDVGIILDVRRVAYSHRGGEALLEHAVQAAATLADGFLLEGNRVGLLIYGSLFDWTFPGYGKLQRERILHALARAELGDSLAFERMDRLPTRLLPSQAQVVLISPLLPDDVQVLTHLRANGYQLLAVSPNPVGVEVQRLASQPALETAVRIASLERTLLLKRLRQTGAFVLDWNVDVPLDRAVHAAFGRRPIGYRMIGAIRG